jgi:quinol monooxygenase YgiN
MTRLRNFPSFIFLCLISMLFSNSVVFAADAPVSYSPAYVVTYLDVHVKEIPKAVKLLKSMSVASHQETGVMRYEVLERMGQPDQFAILEAWQDTSAMQAHQQSPTMQNFKEKLSPLLRSSYDERPHAALQVGEIAIPSSQSKKGIFAITHVDIVPTVKEQGVALVKDLAEQSAKDNGNVRFEALTQISRPNHMTIVEIWQNQNAITQHASQAQKKMFREKLSPISGSLYDERFYKLISN